MKGTEFKQLFPHYNQTRFIIYEDNSEVDFVLGASGLLLLVDDKFLRNPEYAEFLGINKQEKKYLQTYGIEKYKNWKHPDDFQQRYQKKLDKQRTTPRQQNWGQKTEEYWENKRREELEQTKLKNTEWEKEREAKRELAEEYELAEKQARKRVVEAALAKIDLTKWQPRLWSGRGTVPAFIVLDPAPLVFDFPVYVTETDFFRSRFEPPKTNWNAKTDNILTEKFDVQKDKYFCALGAAYTISYKGGFSKEHMKAKGIAGSLAKYAVYFHMQRFLTYPNLLNLSNAEKAEIQQNIPITKIWKKKFVATQEIPELWESKQKNKANIRKIHADYYNDGGGQHGIYYEEVEKITNTDENDWDEFIRANSDGFTIYGQKLLEKALESFCYAILGAQAKTLWEIVNDGTHSGQTQDVFQKLVHDTILELDTTKSVANMRKAIKDTNVRLNLVLSPGVSLLPSNMVLNTRIPGFNNILVKADKYMKFGVNTSFNTEKLEEHQHNLLEYKQHVEQQKFRKTFAEHRQSPQKQQSLAPPKPQSSFPKQSLAPPKPQSIKPHEEKHDIVEHPESNTTTYVVLGVVISLLTKFIVYELL